MRVDENSEFRGQAKFWDLKANDACIEDKHVAADAAIGAAKLQHQHRATYAQESATTAAAGRDEVIHVVKGETGTLKTFTAGCVVASLLDAIISVDLHKNGASVLDAPIAIDLNDAAYAIVAGTIQTAPVVVGDVLEVVVTVAAGGGTLGKGVFASLDLFEDVD